MRDSKGGKANKKVKQLQFLEIVRGAVTVVETWDLRLRIVRGRRPESGVSHVGDDQGSGFEYLRSSPCGGL